MSWLAFSASFEYLGYGATAIIFFQLFQCGDREFRRQNLASKLAIPALKELRSILLYMLYTHLYFYDK